MIEEAGFRYAPPPVVPNSFNALQLSELARDKGMLGQLHVKLFSEHWSEGRDISDKAVLLEIAGSVGLSEAEVLETFSDGRYGERIAESTKIATEFGINGIPAWVIDYELLVVGAQPAAVLEQAMDRLGYKPLGE